MVGKRGKTELVVVKLSGSLFASDNLNRVAKSFRHVLNKKKSMRLILVAGGGATARQYIAAASKYGADQATLDEIGIGASRLNAMLVVSSLKGLAVEHVPTTLREIVQAYELGGSKRVVAVGGLHPGQSTNAVAALIAERLDAKMFINATDVEGVYSKNPSKFNDAKLLKRVTPKELERILKGESIVAGGYDLIDPVALKLIQRSKIPTIVMRCDAKALSDVLTEKKSHGTKIVFGH